jgi:hypothetical protein
MTEERRKYIKEYRIKNIEAIKKRMDKYYQDNKERYKENQKKYYQDENKIVKKKEYLKEYRKTVTYKISNHNRLHKRRAKIKQTDITAQFLFKLKAKTTHCEICGKKLKDNIHLDHIIPLNIGGLHIKSNVRYVHAKCNLQRPKNGSDIIQFKLLL